MNNSRHLPQLYVVLVLFGFSTSGQAFEWNERGQLTADELSVLGANTKRTDSDNGRVSNKAELAKERNSAVGVSAIIGLITSLILSETEATDRCSSIAPNVMFTFDDSGSMYWAYMPDSIFGDRTQKRATAANYNFMYYNPNVVYATPVDANGAAFTNPPSFAAAWDDGYAKERGDSTCSVNLSTTYKASWYYGDNCDGDNDTDEFVSNTAQAAYYHVFYKNHPQGPQSVPVNCTADDETDNDCYIKVVVGATSGNTSLFGGGDERQNFATWYSYYRRRTLAAKAAVGQAFAAQSSNGLRVGYGSINTASNSVDGTSTRTIDLGVRMFGGADRQAFFDRLYAATASGSTPLRRAVDDVGQYFKRTDGSGPWSSMPGTSGGTDSECRKSYHILLSDGFWNTDQASTAAARDNNDGTAGPNGYEPVSPYADTYSNTLADVAMYYWKNDLRTDLADEVPPGNDDPAMWQHLTTFTLGFGIQGTISKDAAFDAIGDDTVTINWPDPTDTEDLDRVDDMLHAAINGHGDYFSTGKPTTLAQTLEGWLFTFSGRNTIATDQEGQ